MLLDKLSNFGLAKKPSLWNTKLWGMANMSNQRLKALGNLYLRWSTSNPGPFGIEATRE